MKALPFAIAVALLSACGVAEETVEPDDPAAEATLAGESVYEGAPEAVPEVCDLLDPAGLRPVLDLAPEVEITVEDLLQAEAYRDDARSCSWTWDGGRIDLQVTREPEGNQFDTWASRMVEKRLASDSGDTAVAVGDGGAYRATESALVWRRGETWLVHLSYGGPSPDSRLDLESLRALAQEVERRF
jgi:hypothetical protein